LKNIAKYAKCTKDYGITLTKSNLSIDNVLNCYTDSDFASCKSTRKSVSGCIILWGSSPIYWSSKQQSTVAISTCEAEIRAIAAALPAIKSALYIKKLMIETINNNIISNIEVDSTVLNLSAPLTILEDNKAAIDWSNKSTSTQRMRHIEKSLYWIRQYTKSNFIRLVHIESENQLADIGTKPLSVIIFSRLAQQLMTYYN
jgi:hypothetical protein